MSEQLYYTIVDTDAGWIGISGSTKGLLRITLPQRSSQKAHELLGESTGHAIKSVHLFDDLITRLRIYFSGQEITFPIKLALAGATTFQRKVWAATRLISYGETRSYSWVAKQINRPGASRAVGQALKKNTLPVIIPCHRVIANNGKLGGYSGGLETKKHLLFLEASAQKKLFMSTANNTT